MMLHRSFSASGKRRAAATVEAAVVLPTFILFVGGVLDLGRLTKATNAIANGARNGAQVATVNSSAYLNTSVIRAAVMTELSGLPQTSGTNPTVNVTTSTVSSNTFVKVQVVYDLTGTYLTRLFPVSNLTRRLGNAQSCPLIDETGEKSCHVVSSGNS